MRFLTSATHLGLLILALSGCVSQPQAALVSPEAAAAALTQANAAHYAARVDGSFSVPTVPVEKVPSAYQKQDVDFASAEPVGSIIINPAERHLYLITAPGKATQYGISVGKAGFEWAGVANITNRKTWPTWTPPKEMITRKPELEKWKDGQPGGPTNPLGARALYLTTNGIDYGYRIHGTPDWWSIGKNASSGCIRMINQDVMELYERVQDGAKVVVLNADGSYPAKLKLPPKPVVKAEPVLEPVVETVVAASIIVPKPSVMPAPVITTGSVAPNVAAPSVTPPAVCTQALVNGVCPAN